MKVGKNILLLFTGALLGSLILQVTDVIGQTRSSLHIAYVDMDALIAQHPNRTAYQKELNEFIQKRKEDLRSKSSLPDLTDKQKAQLQNLSQQYEKEVYERDQELTKKIVDDIQKKVEEVAKKKGLELVLQKSAILYGGQDLTSDVLKMLTRSK